MCLSGQNACPPEDCGGVWGYEELQQAIRNPNHESHEDLMAWMGLDSPDEFDPKHFDPDAANHRLAAAFPPKRRRSK